MRLVADDGPSKRYRAFLRVLLGEVRVVVGTRAAAFAPVQQPRPVRHLRRRRRPARRAARALPARAPGAGAARRAGAGGAARRRLRPHRRGGAARRPAVGPPRSGPARRACAAATPRVEAPTEVDLAREGAAAAARIPHPAWRLVKEALATGPVLVQVARGGYVPVVACARCREPARCRTCHGPLRLERAGAAPTCAWCGRHATDWACPTCGATALRASRVGSSRTAEELGRAFPSVPVVVSGTTASHGVVETVDDKPRLVVATPGAEPVARGGYAGRAAARRRREHLPAGAVGLGRGAAPLARGRGAGARRGRRRAGHAPRTAGAGARPGARAVGPCRLRRAGAGRAGGALLPAGGAHGGGAGPAGGRAVLPAGTSSRSRAWRSSGRWRLPPPVASPTSPRTAATGRGPVAGLAVRRRSAPPGDRGAGGAARRPPTRAPSCAGPWRTRPPPAAPARSPARCASRWTRPTCGDASPAAPDAVR